MAKSCLPRFIKLQVSLFILSGNYSETNLGVS